MPRTPPDTSSEHAARARRAYAENRPVRSALRRGDMTIATVMREQPSGLADRTLFEILLMAHQFGRRRLRALNARAVEEHLNLAVTLDVADHAKSQRDTASFWSVSQTERRAGRMRRGAVAADAPLRYDGVAYQPVGERQRRRALLRAPAPRAS